MNLLVYEHISGGGIASEKMVSNILSEGYSMLRSLISDVKYAGHRVITLLDSRLKKFEPPIEADKIDFISSPSELDEKLRKNSSLVDATYVIAPEKGKMLQKLVKIMETCGRTSLNCRSGAIKKASNKMKILETIKKKGIRVPETVRLNIHQKTKTIRHLVEELGYPLVFKPLDGVGCSGVSLVKNENQITPAIKKIARESISGHCIAQERINGVNASVSVISTDKRALPVTLNQQIVTLASPREKSRYHGGIVPFNHTLKKEALKVAQASVESIGGLRGYVGVDLVLTEEEPVVIEINPRLTTSYIGLRKVVNFNPAQAVIDAVFEKQLSENVQSSRQVFFLKVKIPPLHPPTLLKTYRLDEFVSPPFPVLDNESTYALLAFSNTKHKKSRLLSTRLKRP